MLPSCFSYEYEIEVKIPSPKGILNLNSRPESRVIIKAEHAFGNFTHGINTSDKIWFKGVLRTSLSVDDSTLGKFHNEEKSKNSRFTRVELTAVGCLQCADKNLTPVTIKNSLKMGNRLKDLQSGLKYFLNVIFNPLLTFK